MYEEIAKNIFDNTKQHKLLDSETIINITLKLIQAYKLDKYVEKVAIIGHNNYDNTNQLGQYTKSNKTITINVINHLNQYDYLNYNDLLLINSNLVLTLLHEFDHVKLEKKIDNNYQTIDVFFKNTIYKYKQIIPELEKWFSISNKLYEYSKKEQLKIFIKTIPLIIKSYNVRSKCNHLLSQYASNHDIDPTEKRANINSHIELSCILDLLYNTSLSNLELEEIRYIQYNNFENNCLEGYKLYRKGITNSPSYDYLKSIKRKKELLSLDIYDNNHLKAYIKANNKYSLQERILYGLPLNKDELEQINENDNPFKIYTKKV